MDLDINDLCDSHISEMRRQISLAPIPISVYLIVKKHVSRYK